MFGLAGFTSSNLKKWHQYLCFSFEKDQENLNFMDQVPKATFDFDDHLSVDSCFSSSSDTYKMRVERAFE